MSSNLTALKKLAAKVKGGGATAADINGNTNDDVIEYMATYFTAATFEKLEASIGAGDDAGKLIIKAKINGTEKTAKVTLTDNVTLPD